MGDTAMTNPVSRSVPEPHDAPGDSERDSAAVHVKVLLATRNGAAYLREQLESIHAQTHRNWSIDVADDGSSDETLQIVREFAERVHQRVEILAYDRVGSAQGNFRRLLIECGPADLYALCDQDDVWQPMKLERMAMYASPSSPVGVPTLAFSDLSVVDQSLNVMAPSFYREIRARPGVLRFGTVLVENAVPGCAMVFDRSLLDLYRQIDQPHAEAVMHDWWIMLIAAAFGEPVYVPGSLVLYRQHSANALGSVHRSGLAFVVRKLRGIADRSNYIAALCQGASFRQCVIDSEEWSTVRPSVRATLDAFSIMSGRGKLTRVYLSLRYGILKQTLSRSIFQLLRA